jgi:hypothetical protein
MSNSLATNSVNVQGSANVTAPCIYAAGGAYQGGTVDLTTCGAIKTNQPPVADPYSSQSMPDSSGKCSNGGAATDPGHYCSLTYKGGASLNPGVYIVDGGSLTLNASASVSGSGVTFYLVNGASVSMNGNAHVSLSAPTSGTYSGMLFLGDRSDTGGITINGDSTSSVTGIIYAPDASVSYIGNFSGSGGCTQIVAQTISLSGNTTFSSNCTGKFPPVQVGSVVKLSA